LDAIRRQLKLLDEQLGHRRGLHKQILTRSPLLPLVCGLIVGIAAQSSLKLPIAWPLTILGICITVAAIALIFHDIRGRLYLTAYTVVIGFACLGAIRLISFYQPPANDISRIVGSERTLATIRGTVVTKPHTEAKDSWQFGVLSWTPPAGSFYLKLDKVKTPTGWARTTGTVRFQVSATVRHIQNGDYIQAYCWLSRAGPPLNPGQFDFADYLKQKGLAITATVNSREAIEILTPAGPVSFAAITNKLKSFATEALFSDDPGDDPADAMLAALLLGRRSNISADTYHAFRQTGLLHFISLSGMHLGILAALIWWLSKLAGLSKCWRAIICILITVIFVLIVPPRGPTLRAAFICWVFCASVIIRRRPNALNSLSLAAIVLLLLRPTELFNAGWQLSYTTVLGIIILQPSLSNWLLEKTIDKAAIFDQPPNKLTFSTRSIKTAAILVLELLSVGLSAWLGGAAVLLYHFHSITPLAFIWTVLTFPLVFAILIIGFLKIALAALLPTLSVMLGMALGPLADWFIRFVEALASLNISEIIIGRIAPTLVVFYYCLLLFARFGHLRKAVVKKTVCWLMAATIIFAMGFTKYQRTWPQALELTCLAVGHGQAVFAAIPGGGNDMLFDAGSITTKDCGRRIIVPFLRQRGIGKINAIFLSHDDIDHINGVPEIVSQCKVQNIYANPAMIQKTDNPSTTAAFLSDWLKNRGRQLNPQPDKIQTSRATITSLWPTTQTCRDDSLGDNDKSQVTLIEFAGRKILLCSDIQRLAQRQILKTYPNLKADVMVIPHHGSTRHLADGFIEKIGADILIVSCGYKGYTTMAIRPKANSKTFYTAANGAITVTIDNVGEITTACFNHP